MWKKLKYNTIPCVFTLYIIGGAANDGGRKNTLLKILKFSADIYIDEQDDYANL